MSDRTGDKCAGGKPHGLKMGAPSFRATFTQPVIMKKLENVAYAQSKTVIKS